MEKMDILEARGLLCFGKEDFRSMRLASADSRVKFGQHRPSKKDHLGVSAPAIDTPPWRPTDIFVISDCSRAYCVEVVVGPIVTKHMREE